MVLKASSLSSLEANVAVSSQSGEESSERRPLSPGFEWETIRISAGSEVGRGGSRSRRASGLGQGLRVRRGVLLDLWDHDALVELL